MLWNKIGVAYHHMFALDEARKYYQMALAMNPNYADALNNLAAVYHGQHEYKQAERTYKQALKYRAGKRRSPTAIWARRTSRTRNTSPGWKRIARRSL